VDFHSASMLMVLMVSLREAHPLNANVIANAKKVR